MRNFIPYILTLLAGSISALSMAPYHWWPLLFCGLSILYVAIHKSGSCKSAALHGYLFGFGYFVFNLYWIGNALLVDGNDYAWAYPLAVAGLPALLSFFPALACAASKKIHSFDQITGFLGFCAFLALSEWLRGHVFSGFPWNLYGYAWGNTLEMLQIVSIGNIYYLTLLTLLWGCSSGFLYLNYQNKKNFIPVAIFTIFSIGFIYAYGTIRLHGNPTQFDTSTTIKVVQPNIPQHEKWDPALMGSNFFKALNLSASNGEDTQSTLIIWPETAINYWIINDPIAKNALKATLSRYKKDVFLITGALLKTEQGYTNSLLVFDKSGEIIHSYDKHHLVPFGEYIPLQDYIPLKEINRFSGFEAGSGLKTIELNNYSFSPLICYEILFPSSVINRKYQPNSIINVTNDAWYGSKVGPQQHFLKARLRAIEEGVPVYRSANTGISAIIDAYGRILEYSSVFTTNRITSLAPISLQIKKWPVWFENLTFISICLLGLFLYRRRLFK